MAADRTLALRYADHMGVAFPEGSPAERRATAIGRSYIAYGRFAPGKALDIPERADDLSYVKVMRHYARGEAFAASGNAQQVLAEAAAIRAIKPGANEAGLQNNITIAAGVLDGRAAMLKGDTDAAAKAFREAAELQERVFALNFDPPPWWYPVRRSLAAAELKAGKAEDAARDAQASLKRWPGDPLALQVLAEAEQKTGDRHATADRAEATRAWRGNAPMPIELI